MAGDEPFTTAELIRIFSLLFTLVLGLISVFISSNIYSHGKSDESKTSSENLFAQLKVKREENVRFFKDKVNDPVIGPKIKAYNFITKAIFFCLIAFMISTAYVGLYEGG